LHEARPDDPVGRGNSISLEELVKRVLKNF